MLEKPTQAQYAMNTKVDSLSQSLELYERLQQKSDYISTHRTLIVLLLSLNQTNML